jgi:hypothetical protein
LGRRTSAGVGFFGGVVWLEGCIMGRFGVSEEVVMEVEGLDVAEVGLVVAGVVGCAA